VSPRFKTRRCGLSAALTAVMANTAMAAFIALLIGWPPAKAAAQSASQVSEAVPVETDTPPLAQQVGFFRKVLSKADGDRCSMSPSCSTYALESLKKHGALMGWVMACDRLLRCGHDEVRLAPSVRVGQHPRAYDPVANNDFWWSPPDTAATTSP
jgi:uncharacterized protein